MRHSVRVLAVAVLTILAFEGRALGAQEPASILGRHGVEFGADLGWSGSVSSAFATNQVCPARTAASLGLRLRARLGRWFGAELTGQDFQGISQAACADAPLPEPPAQGPWIRRYEFFDSRIVGYPYEVMSARLDVVPLSQRAAEIRAFAGVGRIFSKNLTIPQSGVVVILGRGEVRFMTEAAFWWYDVPQHRLTENFQDGKLLVRRDDIVSLHARTSVFRAGLIVR
jgi:hypothetical protein